MPTPTQRLLLFGKAPYYKRVLATNPIAYWPLWETSGTTAACQVNTAQNGTYARNVTLMGIGAGIGDGNAAPLFNGAADFVTITSAALALTYNNDEGTIMCWAKVGAGIWTDGVLHMVVRTTQAGTPYQRIYKSAVNNTLEWVRYDATAGQIVTTAGHSDAGWMCLIMTWTQSGNAEKGFKNGAQSNATQVGLFVAPGALIAGWIGANSAVPANPWNGSLAHCAIWNRALSVGEIAALAVA